MGQFIILERQYGNTLTATVRWKQAFMSDLQRDAMVARRVSVSESVSVCLYRYLLHADVVSKRLNGWSRFLGRTVTQSIRNIFASLSQAV